MDIATKKKLIVPFFVFLSLLALNINSIVSGVNHHQIWRVVIASVSTIIVLVVFVAVLRSAKRSSDNASKIE